MQAPCKSRGPTFARDRKLGMWSPPLGDEGNRVQKEPASLNFKNEGHGDKAGTRSRHTHHSRIDMTTSLSLHLITMAGNREPNDSGT